MVMITRGLEVVGVERIVEFSYYLRADLNQREKL